MNFRQRFYDSYDRSNYNFKVTNSYYHFKNIQKIVYRKPEYNPYINIKSPRLNLNIHSYKSNINNYMLSQQNKAFKKAIENIRNSVVKPKLNLFYKLKEEKMREYRRASKTLETKELKRENSRFHKRLKSQKSFLNLREMDQDYKLNHQRIIDRNKKINKKFMNLPPINSIMKKFESSASNKIIKTQGNELDKMNKAEPHQQTMRYIY